MNLPKEIAEACAPLFEAIPIESAMQELVGFKSKQVALVEKIVSMPVIAAKPDLVPGLWLYVDDFARGHDFIQDSMDPANSYWHGIMHRREGDFSNSKYWFNRAKNHPLFVELNPNALVDEVAADNGKNNAELIGKQRLEWQTMFEWCARE